VAKQANAVPANWRDVLGARDRRALTDDGFLHVRAAADASAVDAMRAAWARLMAEPVFPERGNNDGPAGLDEEPAFRHCLEHPYVMSAVAQMLDGDVNLLAFRGRNPQRDSGQQGFHVDSAQPVPADRQVLVNVFWMLDDMDEANGATRLILGSHRLGRPPPKGFQQRDARHPQARSIEARAGDVIVFTAHLWHAGSKNLSGAPRRIAMASFCRQDLLAAYSAGSPYA
jgi:phytanoyl-CoA dioxygenase PhyH